jgi:pimeloyl-ACP methyl ester carboxylesterase
LSAISCFCRHQFHNCRQIVKPDENKLPGSARLRHDALSVGGYVPQRPASGHGGGFLIALIDALKIETAILAGYDWGAGIANTVAALWPARCKAMGSVSGYLIANREVGRPKPSMPGGTSSILPLNAVLRQVCAPAPHRWYPPQEAPQAFAQAVVDADNFWESSRMTGAGVWGSKKRYEQINALAQYIVRSVVA